MNALDRPDVIRARLATTHVCGAPAPVAELRLRQGAVELEVTLILDGTLNLPRGVKLDRAQMHDFEQVAQAAAIEKLVDAWSLRREKTAAEASSGSSP